MIDRYRYVEKMRKLKDELERLGLRTESLSDYTKEHLNQFGMNKDRLPRKSTFDEEQEFELGALETIQTDKRRKPLKKKRKTGK